MLAEGLSCGLHRMERLMRLQALKARPRRRRLPSDLGERQATAVAANVLDRTFEASAPNRKWIADFTYLWTPEGCPQYPHQQFQNQLPAPAVLFSITRS